MNSLSFYIDAGWFLALFLVLLGIFRLHATVTLLHPHNYNKKEAWKQTLANYKQKY